MERVLSVGGLALLLYHLLVSFPVYPSPWEVVLAATIFLVMLWSPFVAYFLATAAVFYPLYTVSLYLAVLFLVIMLLAQRIIIHNLGATLLVLLTPWLMQYHIAWMVPLLAGLWWGKSGGAWIGALSALWTQLLFALSGSAPDILALIGQTPTISILASIFGTANSLETLRLIAAPFTPSPTLLLYYLLQITLWSMVAALAGGLTDRIWGSWGRPRQAVIITFGSATGLLTGHIGLAAWLEQYSGDRLYQLAPQLVLSLLASTAIAAGLDILRDFLEHPLPVRQTEKERLKPVGQHPASQPAYLLRFFKKKSRAEETYAPTSTPLEVSQPLPTPTNLPRREGKKNKQDDIIKIELD